MSYTNPVYSAEFCGITFQGNNRRQQDALFLNDDIYQTKAFTSPIQNQNAFCVAVADGLASSPSFRSRKPC